MVCQISAPELLERLCHLDAEAWAVIFGAPLCVQCIQSRRKTIVLHNMIYFDFSSFLSYAYVPERRLALLQS